MYDGSGSLGRLDLYLYPYYRNDLEEGRLTDEEAIFHIAQNLLRVSDYIQLGGYDEQGKDNTNPVSFLVLEAVHQMKIPANVAVAVGRGIDRALMKRGVEILFEDKLGIPKFLGLDPLHRDFLKNGYSLEVARNRIYNGCHWFAVPGREYGMNDLIKLNFAKVFDVALREMLSDSAVEPSLAELWNRFEKHLRRAVDLLAEGLDFHMEHMYEVFPELVLDLLCYGPIEKGLDVSQPGALEYVNLCIDGSALATTADSFAALEQRIEEEERISWQELLQQLDSDWSAPEGPKVRAMMKKVPHYGYGGSKGDEYAVRIVQTFTRIVSEKPTPKGHKMIPGLFSWASTLSMGKKLGATPNGRRAGEPISFGSNPDPGFRKDGALTALAEAVAAVQPAWGNPAPLQIEVDPGFSKDEGGIEKICTLMETHFELGGTEININILDKERVLAAHKDPSKYPDLVVRVTGFSAYFASLSPEMREVVVKRIVTS
jgi:formate C-acetyltransferase